MAKKKNCLGGIPNMSGKGNIVSEVAKSTGVKVKDAKAVVDTYWRTIVSKLKDESKKAKGDPKVTIPYIGTISVKEVQGRKYKVSGLSSTSKKTVTTKDHKSIKFTTSQKAIDFLNGKTGASIDKPEPKKGEKKSTGKSTAKSTGKSTNKSTNKSTAKGKGKGKK